MSETFEYTIPETGRQYRTSSSRWGLELEDPQPVVDLDGPLHTDERPFCSDETCPCHEDNELFDEYVMAPMTARKMTSYEANRLMWPE